MRGRWMWMLVASTFFGACWAKFPDERMDQIDGSLVPDSSITDSNKPPGETSVVPDRGPLPDVPVTDALVPDGVNCNDVDKDGHTDCAGDCNDADPKVFPGQTEWQATASNGSFDYNCDNQEEPQYPDVVNCQISKGKCTGAGWVGTVPTCGDQGQLSLCIKSGSDCVADTAVATTQACR